MCAPSARPDIKRSAVLSLHHTIPFQIWRAVTDQVAALPRHAQVEISNVCNLNCKMCFRHFLDLDVRHMEWDVYTNIIDQLAEVPTITISGYGEALCHPRFHDAVRYAKDRGHYTRTTSNGLLINSNEKLQKLIDSGLDYIAFSIENIEGKTDIGHPNAQALGNIASLIEMRNAQRQKSPMITLQTLMLKNKEQDVLDIIDWGERIGAERVNVARFETSTLTDVERPSLMEEKALFRTFAKRRKSYRIKIDCLQDQVSDGLSGLLYKHFKQLLRMDSSCIRIKDFLYVGVDGMVRPCCALIKQPMGNILENDLRTIWTSNRFQRFRKNYKKIPWCARCDFARLGQINSVAGSNCTATPGDAQTEEV